MIKKGVPANDLEGLLSDSGDTTPVDGTSGYAAACLFQNTATGVLYVNKSIVVGSCEFTAVTVA